MEFKRAATVGTDLVVVSGEVQNFVAFGLGGTSGEVMMLYALAGGVYAILRSGIVIRFKRGHENDDEPAMTTNRRRRR